MTKYKSQSCPTAVANYVQNKMLAIQHRQLHPHWLHKLVYGIKLDSDQYTADVYQHSDCDVSTASVFGSWIGEWIVFPDRIEPLVINPSTYIDYSSFDQKDPHFKKLVEKGLVNFTNKNMYVFALSGDSLCVLHEQDEYGRITRKVFELPNGIESQEFGCLVKEEKGGEKGDITD